MPRFHNINGQDVQFTQEEETLRDLEEAAWEAKRPMQEWQSQMQSTDGIIASPTNIARFMEDFYDANPDKLAVKPQQFKDTHAERKIIRANRPV